MENIAVQRIKQTIETHYGYQAKQVQAVKGGTVGETYAIDKKYFLKLYHMERGIAQRCTQALNEQLLALELLFQHSSLKDRICYPIRTVKDELFFINEGVIGVLFSYIFGNAIGFGNPYSEDELLQLSKIVKDLHAVDTAPFYYICPKENYHLEFCNELKFFIEQRSTELPINFRNLIAENSINILEKLDKAEKAAEQLREKKLPMVLCHTDIHGGNIMRDPNGKLYLIDWENMMLAPKEADLFLFCEEEYFPIFADNADELALTYYSRRRDLEDLWEFLSGILCGEYDRLQQQTVFVHIKRILNHLT